MHPNNDHVLLLASISPEITSVSLASTLRLFIRDLSLIDSFSVRPILICFQWMHIIRETSAITNKIHMLAKKKS